MKRSQGAQVAPCLIAQSRHIFFIRLNVLSERHRMRNLLFTTLIISLLATTGLAYGKNTLFIGAISSNPGEEIKITYPFAEYLANQLQDMGIKKGNVVVTTGISTMADKLRAQEVDIYIDSPYPIVAVSRLVETKILLRRWKKGKAEYNSKFVVPADSPMQTMADLKGKMVAFEDEYSTSGYFLPKSELVKNNFTLKEYTDKSSHVDPENVGFVFSKGKSTTLLWTMRGLVDAGGVGGHDIEKFNNNNPGMLRVIHETPSVPRNLVSCRADLDDALIDRIRDVLLSMEATDEGQTILQQFEKTTRFDEIPGGAEKALAPLFRVVQK